MANSVVENNPWGREWTGIIRLDTAGPTGPNLAAAGTICEVHSIHAAMLGVTSGMQVVWELQEPGGGNTAMRGALLNPGNTPIEFSFDPPVTMNGVSVSAHAIAASGTAIVTVKYRHVSGATPTVT